MGLIFHYISLFAPYKMPDRNILCVYVEITAAALEKACMKYLLWIPLFAEESLSLSDSVNPGPSLLPSGPGSSSKITGTFVKSFPKVTKEIWPLSLRKIIAEKVEKQPVGELGRGGELRKL